MLAAPAISCTDDPEEAPANRNNYGANLSEYTTLKTAIHANAMRLFEKDTNCNTNFEPQNTDLISSCLTEAALQHNKSSVLEITQSVNMPQVSIAIRINRP